MGLSRRVFLSAGAFLGVAQQYSFSSTSKFFVAAEEAEAAPAEVDGEVDPVTVGSKVNFDELLLERKYNLVEFYAPWCGHCKALAGPYSEAAKMLAEKETGSDVRLIKVDATAETELADRFQVQGYPTLLWFVNGINSEYEGPRTANGIVEWIEEHMLPSLRESTEADIAGVIEKRTPAEGIFVFKGPAESFKSIATDAAEELRGIGTTYFVPSDTKALTVHTGQDESAEYSEMPTGEVDETAKKALANWAKSRRVPLFGQITEENYEIYVDVARNGMFWVCLDPTKLDDELKKYVPTFQAAAKAQAGGAGAGAQESLGDYKYPKYPMVWIDAKEFEAHAKEELGCTSFPTIVLQKGDLLGDAETTKVDKFVRSFSDEAKSGALDEAAVTKFFDDVASGALAPVEEPDELDEMDEEEGEGNTPGEGEEDLDDMDKEL